MNGKDKTYIFDGKTEQDNSVLTKKDLDEKYAKIDASNISGNETNWRNKLDVYVKNEVDGKGISFKGTDGTEHKVTLDNKVVFFKF